jgi:hypothetical protein
MSQSPSPRGPMPAVTGERPSIENGRSPRDKSYQAHFAGVKTPSLPTQGKSRTPWYLRENSEDYEWALGPDPSFDVEEGGDG